MKNKAIIFYLLIFDAIQKYKNLYIDVKK